MIDYLIQAMIMLWACFWFAFFMFLIGLFLRLIDEAKVISFDVIDKGLVIIDPIESLIESQNNELKKTIRECRNNLTRLMTEMNNSLTMSDLLLIQKEKSFLDAMDYAIDNKENMK